MVCMLHVYTFEILEVGSVKKQITANFARSNRIGNHKYTQDVGAYDSTIEFTATFYYKNIILPKYFELLLKNKSPIWFVMLSGEALQVTIEELEITREWFDGGGIPVKQEVRFRLEAWHE